MKSFLTLSAGLIAGLFASLLLVRAGFPPAVAGLILWMAGGVFGLSLLQFAFLRGPIEAASLAARKRPLRAFLMGVLVAELPILVASVMFLAGAKDMAILVIALVLAAVVGLFWPAAISYQIGQRLAPDRNAPGQLLAGSAVFSGTLLIPVAGWLWLLVLGLMATGGCCLRGRYA
jgi:xanthosine utilization system XapX-like protein